MIRSKTNTSEKNWRLILVGNHGSIRPLGTIKTIMIGLILLLIVAIIGAAVLGSLYVGVKRNYYTATRDLEQIRDKLRTLRDNRDMLMTRLVIAEAKLKSEEKTPPIATEKTQNSAAKMEKPENPMSASTASKSKDNPSADNADSKITPANSVSVSDFRISHTPQSNTITASYILKNTTPGSKKLLSGKCVLLLKGRINNEVTTFPVPNVPWENGIPAAKLGAPFYIRNFMTVNLSRNAPEQSFTFDRGIVYVFENSGTLLLKKEFPIELNYGEEITPN